jgi:hypothetical protein
MAQPAHLKRRPVISTAPHHQSSYSFLLCSLPPGNRQGVHQLCKTHKDAAVYHSGIFVEIMK